MTRREVVVDEDLRFKVHVPYASIECLNNYFIYRGPVLWNALPVHIKECTTLDMFKTNIRCFMEKSLLCISNVFT